MAAEARLQAVLRHLRQDADAATEAVPCAAAARGDLAAADPRQLQCMPLTPSVGAEVSGADLGAAPLAPALVAAIDAALLRHKVLVFRAQRGASTDAQLALVRALNAHWGLRIQSEQQAKSYRDGAFVIRMLPSKPGTQSTVWNVTSMAGAQEAVEAPLNGAGRLGAGGASAAAVQHRWPYHRLLERTPPWAGAGPAAKYALAYGGTGRWTRCGQESTRATNVWHSDDNYVLEPPWATVLRALGVPPCGGDTLFADMGQAMADLSPASAGALRSLAGVSDWMPVFPHYGAASAAAAAAELRELYPPVAHPVVRTHPATGQEVLYCNAVYTRGLRRWPEEAAPSEGSGPQALGPPPPDADELLRELLTLPGVPEYQCRVRWHGPGDVLLWDNRCLQHYAVADFGDQSRRMEHCASLGDVPYLASAVGGPSRTSRLLPANF